MALWLLAGATVVDLGLAALLVAISGFIVGHGPESMQAGRLGSLALLAAVLFCLFAPVAGFMMRANQRPVGGIIVAWLPPIAGLMSLAVSPY
jgi:hypothetical protein